MSAITLHTGKDAPRTTRKRKQKIVVSVRRAELMVLTRNEDGTFDIEYVDRKEKAPVILAPALQATIPKNGMAYEENVGGIGYIFVCDKKTGEHLGYVCDCGFRSYLENGSCPKFMDGVAKRLQFKRCCLSHQ